MNILFANRREAGRLLARKLRSLDLPGPLLVLGLPRGGVPVAFEIALELDAPLAVFTVRKLGVPGHEELAMGAIATGGIRVLNPEVIEMLKIPSDVIDAVGDKEERELHRREHVYRHASASPDIERRLAILVDDGIATGATMLAAANAVRSAGAAEIVIAAPVAARQSVPKLRKVSDQVVVLSKPDSFYSVGEFYQDFSPTADDEVIDLLRSADARVLI
jgi:putative phosphoribosyl transferase